MMGFDQFFRGLLRIEAPLHDHLQCRLIHRALIVHVVVA